MLSPRGIGHRWGKLLVILAIAGGGCPAEQKDKATRNAIAFGHELGVSNPKAACSDRDSDGDGYVSCTLRGDNFEGFLSIECAGAFSLGDGCLERYDVVVIKGRR